MPTFAPWLIQVCQVVVILALAPLVSGLIARAEAVIQQRTGPRILQPYFDLLKLLRKETVLPEPAGVIFRCAPYVSFAAYATIPLLIPVLTTFALPLGYIGDFFAVGLILALASFAVSLAAIDSGSPYAQLGSSRVRSFGAFNEPTVIFVVFVLALITHTELPYAMGAAVRSGAVTVLRPSHLLMIVAFFIFVLNDTGRVPVANHGSTLEFGQIDAARESEYSGPALAFLRWGSEIKQLVLFTILMDVLVVPWGMAQSGHLDALAMALGLLLCKALIVGAAVVVIESSFGKLKLYKIPELSAASFLLAVLAVVMFLFQSDVGAGRLSLFGAGAAVAAVLVLLSEFGLLRSQDVWEQLRLYAFGCAAVAGLAIVTATSGHSNGTLYTLAAVTIALKTLAFPLGVGLVLKRLRVHARVPSVIGAPSAVLLGVALSAFAFIALHSLHLGLAPGLPLSGLLVAVAGLLVAFLLIVLRPYAPSQLIGFLVIENVLSLASLLLAPSLPIALGLILLFDLLVGVVVFVVLIQYLVTHSPLIRTDALQRLIG